MNTDYVRLWAEAFTNNYINGDATGHLQLLLNLLQEENFNSLAKALDFFQDITRYFKAPADNYLKGAMADLKKYHDVKFVIYGHTHQAKEVIIESDKIKGTFRYINTGTYLPQIQEAKVNGFGLSKRMTLTFIYSPDEDGGIGEQGSVSIELRSVKG
ncbi:MAG: hypothetical protein K9N06_11545 [Candidatus Cloacimonetes bacterium]|nr:hypothetical protein [Candidatus Cloacimonadota bacterium]